MLPIRLGPFHLTYLGIESAYINDSQFLRRLEGIFNRCIFFKWANILYPIYDILGTSHLCLSLKTGMGSRGSTLMD